MSSSSRPLPQALVDVFKTGMIKGSKRGEWSDRLISAGNDKEELQNVLYEVVSSYFRIVLSQKALQKNIITLSNSKAIDELVESLDDDEVEEWKSIVQNGDWVGLITHRMCLARFRRRCVVIWHWHSETSGTS